MSTLVFTHEERVKPGRLGEVLRDYGHRLRFVQTWREESFPSDLDEVSAVVSLGGRMNLKDINEHPWMKREMKLLREAHEREIPCIGLCLGSQLLATALGGEVGPLESGPEIGWHEVRLTFPGTIDTIYTGLPWRSMQFHWHHHQVTKPPPGATVLAESDRCRVQAWKAGVRTYGFQYHFEAMRSDMAEWAGWYPDELRQAGASRQDYDDQTERRYDEFSRLADRLCRSIAEYLVTPVVRQLI